MSAGSVTVTTETAARPKMVTVKHPESNKPKPTVKKNKPIQADLDVAKEFIKCKDEGIRRLDLSKCSVSIYTKILLLFAKILFNMIFFVTYVLFF